MDVRRLLRLHEPISIVVDAAEAGERLDLLLARRAFWASRTTVQRWVREGRATLDGVVERRGARACLAGQRIEILAPKTPRDLNEPLDDLLDLPIAHQGDGWLVVEKPPGLQTHPGGGVIKRTLLTALAVRLAGVHEPGGPWLPHRLDRETSGLTVVALRKAVNVRFVEAFERHDVRRRYRARVRGRPGPPGTRLTLAFPLRLVASKPMRVEVRADGAAATTLVGVVHAGFHASELDVEPVTGRQHQIRVHLAHVGHPIIGDPLYDPDVRTGERLHLHAGELVIPAAVAGAAAPVTVTSAVVPWSAEDLAP